VSSLLRCLAPDVPKTTVNTQTDSSTIPTGELKGRKYPGISHGEFHELMGISGATSTLVAKKRKQYSSSEYRRILDGAP